MYYVYTHMHMHTHAHIGHVHQHTQSLSAVPANFKILATLATLTTPLQDLHLQLGIDPRRLRTATPCNTLQYPGFTNRHWSTAIANCNNLQHSASPCNTGAFTTQQIAKSASTPLGLQSAPPARSTAIRTTTHCSTLQRTAFTTQH